MDVREPVGWKPLSPIKVTADDPVVPIPFMGAGYRKVALAMINETNNVDAFGATVDDIGPTAILIEVDAEEPTVVILSVESLPYYLYASGPNDVIVQPFGLVAGEELPLAI